MTDQKSSQDIAYQTGLVEGEQRGHEYKDSAEIIEEQAKTIAKMRTILNILRDYYDDKTPNPKAVPVKFSVLIDAALEE